MKNVLVLTRCAALSALIMLFVFSNGLTAQDTQATRFMTITKLKASDWSELTEMENEMVKPFIQERIKEGNQQSHMLFEVHYPNGDAEPYNFVWIDFFTDFNHLNLENQDAVKMIYSAFPNADISKMMERMESVSKNVGREVFVVHDEAFPGPGGNSNKPVKFVVVNHMKVSEANVGKYMAAESDIFKPMHQKRARDGNMHDWLLCQRIMPYGSEWDNNFVTVDAFNSWSQMGNVGSFEADFKAVHPGKDIEKAMAAMANSRELRRSEVWKLVSYVGSATPEITYTKVKEGTGASPMRGQEVTWRGEIMSPEGERIFSTQSLGFDFNAILGENIYDRFLDKGLMQMKKGGIMKMNMPADAQDKMTRGITGGKDAIVKVELIDVSAPKPNGARMLEKVVKSEGLSAAEKQYELVKADNPEGYVFREADMNALGYKLMGEGDHKAAIYIFTLNQKNHPKSWNACDSLGDGYRAMGNHAKAKECYKKAIAINPEFVTAKQKLDSL